MLVKILRNQILFWAMHGEWAVSHLLQKMEEVYKTWIIDMHLILFLYSVYNCLFAKIFEEFSQGSVVHNL